MTFQHWRWNILMCLLYSGLLLQATELPATVQLDLVFPQDNATYKPTYPFPVVFALHNSSAALKYSTHWNWVIRALEGDNNFNVRGYRDGLASSSPNPTLIIDASSELLNTTLRKFKLNWSFGIHQVCYENGTIPLLRDLDRRFNGSITFNLDPELGEDARIIPNGQCAVPLASFEIIYEAAAILEQKEITCPVLNNASNIIQNCALPVDDTVAELVAERMANKTGGCPGYKPRSRSTSGGLIDDCPPFLGSGSSSGSKVAISITFALVLIVTYLGS